MAIENCHYFINYSFGYVLRNFVTNELRYFHASGGTDRVLLSSRLFSRTEVLMEFLLSIFDDDYFHSTHKPNSGWCFVEVTNITFFFTKRINCSIGCGQNLANFVMDNPGVHALIRNKNTGKMYDDNLCLFRCLALHRGNKFSALEKETLNLFRCCCDYFQISLTNFSGVTLAELDQIENLFHCNIMVYYLEEKNASTTAKLLLRSKKIIQRLCMLIFLRIILVIFEIFFYIPKRLCVRSVVNVGLLNGTCSVTKKPATH